MVVVLLLVVVAVLPERLTSGSSGACLRRELKGEEDVEIEQERRREGEKETDERQSNTSTLIHPVPQALFMTPELRAAMYRWYENTTVPAVHCVRVHGRPLAQNGAPCSAGGTTRPVGMTRRRCVHSSGACVCIMNRATKERREGRGEPRISSVRSDTALRVHLVRRLRTVSRTSCRSSSFECRPRTTRFSSLLPFLGLPPPLRYPLRCPFRCLSLACHCLSAVLFAAFFLGIPLPFCYLSP